MRRNFRTFKIYSFITFFTNSQVTIYWICKTGYLCRVLVVLRAAARGPPFPGEPSSWRFCCISRTRCCQGGNKKKFVVVLHRHLCSRPLSNHSLLIISCTQRFRTNIPLSHDSWATSSRASDWASQRTSVRSGARERNEQCGASERVGGASEQASKRKSEWLRTYDPISNSFESLCIVIFS